jgi:periplasmic copper chaperone A
LRYTAALSALAMLVSVAVAQTGSLVATDAWIRVTPGTDLAAAYLSLKNVGANAVTVIGIQSPVAGHSMIHETRLQGTLSSMRPREQVVVPPGSTVKFEPGGLHVMLHDLKSPLTIGQTVPLTISIAGGTTVQVYAKVRPLSAE